MGEGKGGMFQENSIETCILSRVKQITSPGWMHETSARAWCTGKTQRNRVEREVGGGIWLGNTCKSMADSCQCMTKTTTIKINIGKKYNYLSISCIFSVTTHIWMAFALQIYTRKFNWSTLLMTLYRLIRMESNGVAERYYA